MASCMHTQTFFSICMILPFLNAQSLHIFRPNQTYSDVVCPTVSLGTKSQVITETQCARCYRNDPSCVAFHYSDKERVCHFYNLTVFGVILQDMCDHASGFQFYMQGNFLFQVFAICVSLVLECEFWVNLELGVLDIYGRRLRLKS